MGFTVGISQSFSYAEDEGRIFLKTTLIEMYNTIQGVRVSIISGIDAAICTAVVARCNGR
jgi:hypothetical protein